MLVACGDEPASTPDASNGPPGSSGTSSGNGTSGGDPSNGTSGGTSGAPPETNPDVGPKAGNPDGTATVPAEAQAEDVSSPKTVVGNGTPESCTSEAFVAAVTAGGVITFNCGLNPVKIVVKETARIQNRSGPIVIDGGGKVTLSGGGKNRVLYLNACLGELGALGGGCNESEIPKLTIQNITFVDGNTTNLGQAEENAGSGAGSNPAGGGAIWVRGGRLKIVNARFFNNLCADKGSDLGGGAVRVQDFPSGGSVGRPVYVVNSTFGGAEGFGNSCANGGALSSIGASWTIINSLFTHNTAVGTGANAGLGGNGGAIYNDGGTIRLQVIGSKFENNEANEGGSAIFFVSNVLQGDTERTGTVLLKDSLFRLNPRGEFETANMPGFFVLAKPNGIEQDNATLQR